MVPLWPRILVEADADVACPTGINVRSSQAPSSFRDPSPGQADGEDFRPATSREFHMARDNPQNTDAHVGSLRGN